MKKLFEENSYKYSAETFLLMYLDRYQFVLGSDLENYSKSQELFNNNTPCNIYFVLRRPKVTVNPDSIKVSGKKISFKFRVHLAEKVIEVDTGCEFKNTNSEIECSTKSPYNIVAIADKEKILLVTRPSTLIDSSVLKFNIKEDCLDYEILYIGQAYGKDGKRTAIDRLASHKTVQKIYAQTLTDYPDSDIWFMLSSFSQESILFSAGGNMIKRNEIDKEIDEKKSKHIFENNGLPLTEKQKINLTEAALIKYFEPSYNLSFRDNFPSSTHTSYSECFDLDIRAIAIELNSPEMMRKIYTKKTGRKSRHIKMYELKKDKDRISLLDFERYIDKL